MNKRKDKRDTDNNSNSDNKISKKKKKIILKKNQKKNNSEVNMKRKERENDNNNNNNYNNKQVKIKKTKIKFNTAGPSRQDKHFYLDPASMDCYKEEGLNFDNVLELIGDEKYFVIYGPRQSMKTSFIKRVRVFLNEEEEEEEFKCVVASVEGIQRNEEEVDVVTKIVNRISEAAISQCNDIFPEEFIDNLSPKKIQQILSSLLCRWSSKIMKEEGKKLVVIFDEFDCLSGGPLLYVLGELRSYYDQRPDNYPSSIILCGMRDLQEYKDDHGKPIGSGSPFNIKDCSIRTLNFTMKDVRDLFKQYEDEYGNNVSDEVLEKIFEWTQGQPWLVNKIGRSIMEKHDKDENIDISEGLIDRIVQEIIISRVTHIDSLGTLLKDDRLRDLFTRMVTKENLDEIDENTLSLASDLGLITITNNNKKAISNPIYQHIIPRFLALQNTSASNIIVRKLPDYSKYMTEEGDIDMDKALRDFFLLCKENLGMITTNSPFKEALPHILLQFYLDKFSNSSGQTRREYALGDDKVDLVVDFSKLENPQCFPIEIKICTTTGRRNNNRKLDIGSEVIKQIVGYVNRLNHSKNRGWVVVFDFHKKPLKDTDDNFIYFKNITTDDGIEIFCYVFHVESASNNSSNNNNNN